AKVEAVLCVERGVIFGKIERVEVVAFGLGLRADGAREAQLAEDVADLIHDLRDDVEPAPPLPSPGQREVHIREIRGPALQLALARLDGLFELALQRVRNATDPLAFHRIEARKGFEDFGESTGLTAQELDFELLEPAFVCVRDLFEAFPQRFYGCEDFLATSASCSHAAGSRPARAASTF